MVMYPQSFGPGIFARSMFLILALSATAYGGAVAMGPDPDDGPGVGIAMADATLDAAVSLLADARDVLIEAPDLMRLALAISAGDGPAVDDPGLLADAPGAYDTDDGCDGEAWPDGWPQVGDPLLFSELMPGLYIDPGLDDGAGFGLLSRPGALAGLGASSRHRQRPDTVARVIHNRPDPGPRL